MGLKFDKDFKASVIEHMNSDHADALILYVRAFAPAIVAELDRERAVEPESGSKAAGNVSAITAKLTDVDEQGIMLAVSSDAIAQGDRVAKGRTDNAVGDAESARLREVRLLYGEILGVMALQNQDEVRGALIKMARKARQQLGI